MNILILGSTGMLGHKLLKILGDNHTVTGTARKPVDQIRNHHFFKDYSIIGGISAERIDDVKGAVRKSEPDVIINSIGIVKQLAEAKDPVKSITINSLFPHQLSDLCRESEIRLIHFSTDCVFSGMRGNYSEEDIPDAVDLYGRTKLLGEVTGNNNLTIRTSIIGRELETTHSLVEWFLSQKGKQIQGYKKSVFSGLTTTAHANILNHIISNFKNLHGLYHIASQPINKYDLLQLIREIYSVDVDIKPDFNEICDRSLNCSKFYEDTKIRIPEWPEMIKDMYDDSTPYDNIRSNYVHK